MTIVSSAVGMVESVAGSSWPTVRMFLIVVLSVAAWELAKVGFRNLAQIPYYRRESGDVVLKVKVYLWDRQGKEHFQEQGYSREFPQRGES